MENVLLEPSVYFDDSQDDMAQQLERIAALESDRRGHWAALSVLAIAGLGWLGWITVTLVGMKADLQALKQKIKDGGLGDIVSEIAKPQSPQQLATNLEIVSSTVKLQRLKGARPDPDKLAKLSAAVKVATTQNPELNSAWQTASELISYRSQSESGFPRTPLPDCLDSTEPLKQLRNTPVKNIQSSPEITFVAENCSLRLDDDGQYGESAAARFFKEADEISPGLKHGILISGGTIVYSGGKVIPVDQIIYKDTFFVLTPSFNVPPKRGRDLTEHLLTADLKNGQVDLPNGI